MTIVLQRADAYAGLDEGLEQACFPVFGFEDKVVAKLIKTAEIYAKLCCTVQNTILLKYACKMNGWVWNATPICKDLTNLFHKFITLAAVLQITSLYCIVDGHRDKFPRSTKSLQVQSVRSDLLSIGVRFAR